MIDLKQAADIAIQTPPAPVAESFVEAPAVAPVTSALADTEEAVVAPVLPLEEAPVQVAVDAVPDEVPPVDAHLVMPEDAMAEETVLVLGTPPLLHTSATFGEDDDEGALEAPASGEDSTS